MGDDAEDDKLDNAGLLVFRIRIALASLSPDVGVGVFSFDDDVTSLGRSVAVFVVARRRRVVTSAPLSVSCPLSRPFIVLLALDPLPLMISWPSPLLYSWRSGPGTITDSLRRGIPVGGPPGPGSGPASFPPPFVVAILVLPNECSRSWTPLTGVPIV